ncbi:MAG: J domain-containing protein [Acetobacteraceae bacterium]|nr:J domain-containing protein [Acetobacteraceae bacterium]
MADDPYTILGVQRTDDEATIRAAYRKLAKKFHPDVNPGKPEAAERFKQIAAAYDLLSDSEKRGRFDRGEIDAGGNERPPPGYTYRDFGDAGGRQKYRADSGFAAEDLEDILAQAFGGRGGGAGGTRGNFKVRGSDAHYALTVSFVDAAAGTTRRITLPDGRTLDVTIPAGLEDGHTLRLKGQGNPGFGDGPPGDALVEIAVAPHKHFRREGDDIVLTLPVSLKEAVLGASVEVPTVKGNVRVSVPPNSGTGSRLRLRGRGIGGKGHQYVELEVMQPPGEEPALAAFLRDWTPAHPFDPRAGLKEKE